MIESPGGPAIVLALVLAETAVGGIAILWLTPKLWGHVRTGFFKLAGGVFAVCAVLAWLAARAPLGASGVVPAVDPAPIQPPERDAALVLLAVFAAVAVLWQVLLYARARTASRWAGIAAVPVGVAALVFIAADPSSNTSTPVAVFQLLAGSAFAGAVTVGLLLGHWHLVDRKAAKEPLARVNTYFLAGCAAIALAALLGGTGGGEARADLSPLLGVGVLTVSIAVGLAALCALIGFFIRALVRENSLQSATGLFYLGVMMGLAAEFAAKVRFF